MTVEDNLVGSANQKYMRFALSGGLSGKVFGLPMIQGAQFCNLRKTLRVTRIQCTGLAYG